jgi:hypothetical protein
MGKGSHVMFPEWLFIPFAAGLGSSTGIKVVIDALEQEFVKQPISWPYS